MIASRSKRQYDKTRSANPERMGRACFFGSRCVLRSPDFCVFSALESAPALESVWDCIEHTGSNPLATPQALLLGAGIALLVFVIFSQAAFNLKFLRPDSLVQTFVFAALSALIFLALVALIFVLLRTLLKLYLERQAGTAGSRFRSKMVLGALVLSFGPVIAMFLFAYGLMNRSIDKWFSQPIEEVHGRSAAVTDLLSSYAGQNALAEARAIAANPEAVKAYRTGRFGSLMEEFREHEITLQGGFALAFYKGEIEASFGAPLPWSVLRTKFRTWGHCRASRASSR